MGRSNDTSDWLIKFKKKDKTILLSSKRKLKTNIVKYISLNSTLHITNCNLIEGPFIYKVTGVLGDLWRLSQNTCPLGGGIRSKNFES